jgi:predicted deacylase
MAEPNALLPTNLGNLSSNNTGTDGVWRFDSKRAGPCVLITALIHGNEICGALAMKDLIDSLQTQRVRLMRGSLIIAFSNLAAYARFDASDLHSSRFVDEDMNRIWSAEKLVSHEALATSERRRASELLPFIHEADFHLDLHSMHDPGDPLLLTGLLAKNRAFAKTLNLPAHIIVDAGHSDGVRLRDYRPEPISLLIECGFHLAPSSYQVAKLSTARFLEVAGLLFSNALWPEIIQDEPFDQKTVQVTEAVVARTMALRFASPWQNMQTVPHQGTQIAIDGDVVFTTPFDDCTLIMPSLKQLRPGVTVVRYARDLA